MNEKQRKYHSKFLSLVLRHRPETIGISLDEMGWVDVEVLLVALKKHRHELTSDQLQEIVRSNDKQRFSFNEISTRIRANQGHSLEVELGYEPAEPPSILYHGTPEQFVDSIRKNGLNKQQRHDVHLHTDVNMSLSVGQRRGKPVLLKIEAGRMHTDGFLFYVTPNNVWLTDHVPPDYIGLSEDDPEKGE